MDLTPTELRALQALWNGAKTVRDVVEAIYGEHTPSATATAQKLLERLEVKGVIKRDRSCYPHQFATDAPTEVLTSLVSQNADNLARTIGLMAVGGAVAGIGAFLGSTAFRTALGAAIRGAIGGVAMSSMASLYHDKKKSQKEPTKDEGDLE